MILTFLQNGDNLHKRFQPTGQNSHFDSHHLPFTEYITKMQEIIARSRCDLNDENHDKIIHANSPASHDPTPNKHNVGILLVHGLFDSPSMMQSIFEHYQRQNVIVRSILLPGHGTVPGDLLEVSYHSWLSAIEYGINSILQLVDKVIVIGFSMGGLLSLSASYEYADIAGVILIAPALRIRNPFAILTQWLPSKLGHYWPRLQWINQSADDDYAKYQSHCVNAVSQIVEMIGHLNQQIERSKLSIPVFITMSEQDEVIHVAEVEDFFNRLTHPKNRLLIYSNQPRRTRGKIYFRPSAFPQHRIVDFSHVCIGIHEDHPHYGQHGDYLDIRHYNKWWRQAPDPSSSTSWVYGASTAENMKNYKLARATYNPDFPNLANEFDKFIRECINR